MFRCRGTHDVIKDLTSGAEVISLGMRRHMG